MATSVNPSQKFAIFGNVLTITNVTLADEAQYIGDIMKDVRILDHQCIINLTVFGK